MFHFKSILGIANCKKKTTASNQIEWKSAHEPHRTQSVALNYLLILALNACKHSDICEKWLKCFTDFTGNSMP